MSPIDAFHISLLVYCWFSYKELSARISALEEELKGKVTT